MKTIWKFPFKTKGSIEIHMPRGGLILDLQMQDGIPCIWALVEPDAELESRHFRIYGTGHSILDKGLTYIGTYQITAANLVFHLFEVYETLENS